MPPLRIALLLTLLSQTATAQVIDSRQPGLADRWIFAASAFGGIPVGEFRKYENGGGGAEIVLGFQPWRRQPLVLRGHLGGLMYGNVNADSQQESCDAFGCRTQTVRYDARNHSMAFLQGGPEIMATDGSWRPFVFALAGMTFFNSWANLEPGSSLHTNPPSENIFSSNNFSTSYGGGVRRVGTGAGRETGLELAFRVTRNPNARYLTEEGVSRRSDGTWVVTPRSGAANVALIHIGFWIGPRR